ncbi:TPA: hypothetical protein ACS9Z2_001350, partial [Salmonella enterica subsp. enterica serovar Typhimurium]
GDSNVRYRRAGFTPRLTVHHRPVKLDTPITSLIASSARSVNTTQIIGFIYGVPVILDGGYYRLCDQK